MIKQTFDNIEYYSFEDFKKQYKPPTNIYKIMNDDDVLKVRKFHTLWVEKDWIDDYIKYLEAIRVQDQKSFEDDIEEIIRNANEKNNPE